MRTINPSTFIPQCNRKLNDDFPVARGRKEPSTKIFLGVLLIFLMVSFIWFPLGFFAFSGKIGSPNTPVQVSLQISFDDYNAIYFMTSREDNIHRLGSFYEKFEAMYTQNLYADNELANYGPDDIVISTLSINSKSIWNISPPDKDKLINDLKSGGPVSCRMQFTIYRQSEKEIDQTFYYHDYEIPPEEVHPVRKELYELLMRIRTSVTLPKLMPKFLKVRTNGIVEPAFTMAPEFTPDCEYLDLLKLPESTKICPLLASIYRNITLSYKSPSTDGNPTSFSWWEAKEDCNDEDYEKFYQYLPNQNCSTRLTIILLNDPILPSSVTFFVGGG